MEEKNMKKNGNRLWIAVIAVLLALLIFALGLLLGQKWCEITNHHGMGSDISPDNRFEWEEGGDGTETAVPPETTDPPETDPDDTKIPEDTKEPESTEEPEDTREPETTSPKPPIAVPDDTNVKDIYFYHNNGVSNAPMELKNVFPGEHSVRYFSVKVKHTAPVLLCMDITVNRETKMLSGVVRATVTRVETGKVIYDGVLAAMNKRSCREELPFSPNSGTVATYKVDIYIPTSIGNEYQGALLDFNLNFYRGDAS